MTATTEKATSMSAWTTVCTIDDIHPGTGVCALFEGEQVALFRPGKSEEVFAISNFDPIGKANVMSRGMTGSIGDRMVVASPLYKQHFDLLNGECLEDDTVKVKTFSVRVEQQQVQLSV